MRTKVALLTEIISPYRIPVFNRIARDAPGQFRFFFLGKTEKRRQWKVYQEKMAFPYKVLPGVLFQRGQAGSPYFFNPTILCELIRYSPDIIITGGYQHPGYLLAALYAAVSRKRLILWCESNKYDYRDNHPLKESYKRWFVRNCSAYIVPGRASLEYLLSLGAVADKIFTAPNAVDNDYFGQSRDRYRQGRETFKQSRGYPEKLILYVGRLIEQKGVLDLIKAFEMIFRKHPEWGLLLVGTGEQEEECRDYCRNNEISNVFFAGFIHQEDIPVYYAISDCLVLPTHSDPWGLVLNEAMASGLPVVCSDVAGAACNLISPGENGYIFKKGDAHQLAAYISDILSDDKKRMMMGQRSLEIIKGYSPAECAGGFIRAACLTAGRQEI